MDELSQTFVAAWKVLDVQYDQFFRTTSSRHLLAVQELFRRLKDALSPKTGQPVLYENAYEGLYCEGCEGFKTEKDLDERPLPRAQGEAEGSEETKLPSGSPARRALLKRIDAHPDFIWPDYRRNEVVNDQGRGPGRNVVPRGTGAWGIPAAGGDRGRPGPCHSHT